MRSSCRLIGLIAMVAAPVLVSAQTYPTGADPRADLKPGRYDAGIAAKYMRLVSTLPKPAQFDTVRGLTFINSDLAFGNGHYVYQGNFAGFTIWDVSNPAKPTVVSVVECITSQGDPTIYGNLLFLSAEGAGNRNDCGKGGVQDLKDHMAGVRIFDVSNPRAPKLVKNVQTCKGSHTHTIIPSKRDKNIVYIYVSGQQAARPDSVVPGCKNGTDPADTTNSLFQLDIIKVPLDHPENATVIPGARIFTGLNPTPECRTLCAPDGGRRGRGGRGARGAAGDSAANALAVPVQTGPRNCHDVTAYPALNLLAAACSSHSIMVDISNPEKPVRRSALTDTNNFQGRHTAGFSNDGKKIIMTDEWGGGTSPMCQASSIMELGGNTIISLSPDARKQTQRAYFKLPAAQSAQENCVSHNGGLIPVPGRDLYVQGWYQGGVDIMDFTDANKPFEIAFFDRGSIDPPPPADTAKGVELPLASGRGGAGPQRSRGTIGGSWGAYYWNGMIYSSELDRGFDIYELTPSPLLSANEIAAAKLITLKEYNPQSQPKYTWPPAFVVVRSYLDQLVRNNGLAATRTSAVSAALTAAEQKTGAARGAALTALAKQVDGYATGAKDAARVRMMSDAIRQLAAVSK
jgi:hypothetical protein